jgi:hypothetical protein
MCVYCHKDWGKRHSVMAVENGIYSYGGMQMSEGCIDVNVSGFIAKFPANFCPICGRELEEKQRVEWEYISEEEKGNEC